MKIIILQYRWLYKTIEQKPVSIFKALILIFILLLSLPMKADHQYNLIERDGHKIHVVIIDPKEYDAEIEKYKKGLWKIEIK